MDITYVCPECEAENTVISGVPEDFVPVCIKADGSGCGVEMLPKLSEDQEWS